MKKFYQVSFTIALCLLLALPLFPHASANENEVIDYASLFAQAHFISIESNHELVVALNNIKHIPGCKIIREYAKSYNEFSMQKICLLRE